MVKYQQYLALILILRDISLFEILDTILSVAIKIVVGTDIEKYRSNLFLFRFFLAGSDRAGRNAE